MQIYLDGVSQTTVSAYSATRKVQQTLWSRRSLTAGTHTLKLVKASGGFLLLDALQAALTPAAQSVVNDTDRGLAYTGPSWGYYPSRGAGDIADDVHAAYNAGDGISYTFNGTSIGYVTETAPDEGSVQVSLDGTIQATVSATSSVRKVQQTLWSKSGLAAGSHTLKLVNAGGGFLVLDALRFTAAPPPVSGTVNDTDSTVSYSGSGWGYYPNRGAGDFGDDVHATYANGDSVSFRFTGSGVSYVAETNADEGKVAVFIDGVLKQTVDCASASRAAQQTLYSINSLAAGPHTLTLVKQSGGYMLLDAITFQ